MGTLSIWHWIIVLVVVLILFGGRGKTSQLMGDFGKGLKSFKRSMKEDEPFDEADISAEKPREIPRDPAERTAETARDREKDHATRS